MLDSYDIIALALTAISLTLALQTAATMMFSYHTSYAILDTMTQPRGGLAQSCIIVVFLSVGGGRGGRDKPSWKWRLPCMLT